MENKETEQKSNCRENLDELTKFSQECGLYDDSETYPTPTPNIVTRKEYVIKEKYDMLETENKKIKRDLEEANNKLNFYFTCILKASLILEKVTNKKWDNNVESIVQQAQEVCGYFESREDTKDPTEMLMNRIHYLEDRVSHLTKITRGYSKFLNDLAED